MIKILKIKIKLFLIVEFKVKIMNNENIKNQMTF
jgi:hypothetical protein